MNIFNLRILCAALSSICFLTLNTESQIILQQDNQQSIYDLYINSRNKFTYNDKGPTVSLDDAKAAISEFENKTEKMANGDEEKALSIVLDADLLLNYISLAGSTDESLENESHVAYMARKDILTDKRVWDALEKLDNEFEKVYIPPQSYLIILYHFRRVQIASQTSIVSKGDEFPDSIKKDCDALMNNLLFTTENEIVLPKFNIDIWPGESSIEFSIFMTIKSLITQRNYITFARDKRSNGEIMIKEEDIEYFINDSMNFFLEKYPLSKYPFVMGLMENYNKVKQGMRRK